RLERSNRQLVFALLGEDEAAITHDERAETRVAIRCASIDLREQPLGPAKIAGCQQSLDTSRACQLGDVPVELPDLAEKRRSLLPARVGVVIRKLEDRERNPQADGAPSKPACLNDPEQIGDLPACLLGLAPVGADLGEDRQ